MNLLSNINKWLLALIVQILLGKYAFAEYRVFLLEIKDSQGQTLREFPYNLDPDQYRAYFPIPSNQFISYKKTWMCRGRTNEQAFCPEPGSSSSPSAVPPSG